MASLRSARRGRQKSLLEVLAPLSKTQAAAEEKLCAEEVRSIQGRTSTKLPLLLRLLKNGSKGGSSPAEPGAETRSAQGGEKQPVEPQLLKRKRVYSPPSSSRDPPTKCNIPFETSSMRGTWLNVEEDRQDSGTAASWKTSRSVATSRDENAWSHGVATSRDENTCARKSSVGSCPLNLVDMGVGRSSLYNEKSPVLAKENPDIFISSDGPVKKANLKSAHTSTGLRPSLGVCADGSALQMSKSAGQAGSSRRDLRSAASMEELPANCCETALKDGGKEDNAHRCCICGRVYPDEETYMHHWKEEMQGVLDDTDGGDGGMQFCCNIPQSAPEGRAFQTPDALRVSPDRSSLGVEKEGTDNADENEFVAGCMAWDSSQGPGRMYGKKNTSDDGSSQSGTSRFEARAGTEEPSATEHSAHRGAHPVFHNGKAQTAGVNPFFSLVNSQRTDKTPTQTIWGRGSQRIPDVPRAKHAETASGNASGDGVLDFLKVLGKGAPTECDNKINLPAGTVVEKGQREDQDADCKAMPAAGKTCFSFVNPAAKQTEKSSSSHSVLVIGGSPKRRPAGFPLASESAAKPYRLLIDSSGDGERRNTDPSVTEQIHVERNRVGWRRRGRRGRRRFGGRASKRLPSSGHQEPNTVTRNNVNAENETFFNHYADGEGFWDADQVGLDCAELGVGGVGGWELIESHNPQRAVIILQVEALQFVACRFDLFVYGHDGANERIAYGFVQPYILHLQEAERQYSDSQRRSLILDPCKRLRDGSAAEALLQHNYNCVETYNGASIEEARPPVESGGHHSPDVAPGGETWFTKKTMERFVRFVLNPEILERVVGMNEEVLRLEEAIKGLSSGAEEYAGEEDQSERQTIGVDLSSNQEGHDASPNFLHKLSDRMLKRRVLQKRRLVLQREYALAAGRARAAGFGVETVQALLAFAECFEANRLRVCTTVFTRIESTVIMAASGFWTESWAKCSYNDRAFYSGEDGRRLRVAARVAFFERELKMAEWGAGTPRLKSRNSAAGRWADTCLYPRSPITAGEEVGLRMTAHRQRNYEGTKAGAEVESTSPHSRSSISASQEVGMRVMRNLATNSEGKEFTPQVEGPAQLDMRSSDRRLIVATGHEAEENFRAETPQDLHVGFRESFDVERTGRPSPSPLANGLACQSAEHVGTPVGTPMDGIFSPIDLEMRDSNGEHPTRTQLSAKLEPQCLFMTPQTSSGAMADESLQCADADSLLRERMTTHVDNGGLPRVAEGCMLQAIELERLDLQQEDSLSSDSDVAEQRHGDEYGDQNMLSHPCKWNIEPCPLTSPMRGEGTRQTSTVTRIKGGPAQVSDGEFLRTTDDWAQDSVHLRGWKPLVGVSGRSKGTFQSEALVPKIPPEFKSTISPWQTVELDSEGSMGGGLHLMSPDADLPKRINWPMCLKAPEKEASPSDEQRHHDSDDEIASGSTQKDCRCTEVDDDTKDVCTEVSLEAGSVVASFIEQGWDHDAVSSREVPKQVDIADKQDEHRVEQSMTVMSEDALDRETVLRQVKEVEVKVNDWVDVACGDVVLAVNVNNSLNNVKQDGDGSDLAPVGETVFTAQPAKLSREIDSKVDSIADAVAGAVKLGEPVESCKESDGFRGRLLTDQEDGKGCDKKLAPLAKSRVRRTKSDVPWTFTVDRAREHMNDRTVDGEHCSERLMLLKMASEGDQGSSYHERRDAWLREKRNKTDTEKEHELQIMADVIERKKSQILGQLLERPARHYRSKAVLPLGTVDEDSGFGSAKECEKWEMEAQEMLRTNRQMRVQELLMIWRSEVEKELGRKQEDDSKRSEGLQAQHRVEKVLERLETLLDHHSRGPLSVSVAAASITASINKARRESSPLPQSPSKGVVNMQHPPRERSASRLVHQPESCSKIPPSNHHDGERSVGGVGSGTPPVGVTRRKGVRAVSVSASHTGSSTVTAKASSHSRAISAPSPRAAGSSRGVAQRVMRPSSFNVTSSTMAAGVVSKTKRTTGKVAGAGSVGTSTSNSISISLSLHVKKENVRPQKNTFTKEDVIQEERSDFVVNKVSAKAKPGHRRIRSDGGWATFASSPIAQVLEPSISASDMARNREGSKPCRQPPKVGTGGTVPGTGKASARRTDSGRMQSLRSSNTMKGTGDDRGRRKDRERHGADSKSVSSSESVHRLPCNATDKPAQRRCSVANEADCISLCGSASPSMGKGTEAPKVRSFLRKGTGIGSGNRVKPVHLDSDMKFVITKPYMSPEPVARSISVGVIERARVTVTSINCRIEENGDDDSRHIGGKRSCTVAGKIRQRSKSALPRTSVSTAVQGKVVHCERQRITGVERMDITPHRDFPQVAVVGGRMVPARKGARSQTLGSESPVRATELPPSSSSCLQDSPCTQLLKTVLTKELQGLGSRCCRVSSTGPNEEVIADKETHLDTTAAGVELSPSAILAGTPDTGARHMACVSGKQSKEKAAGKQNPVSASVPESALQQGIRGGPRMRRKAGAVGGGVIRKGESRLPSQRDTKDTIVPSEWTQTPVKDCASSKNKAKSANIASARPQATKTGTGEALWPRLSSPWRFIRCFQGVVTGPRKGCGEKVSENSEQWMPMKNSGLA
ncbi:hypothetical protein CBR_g39533 [Chara braunii]|uniref:Uncharacterized protein n=1 Tax=Chara braunii TaxID=69332 RepID=A0A388LRV3_CHABU|nr:hypothetical protein CBR_g39533 [Chara braunii]|eukprot:GBG85070.1 hypothetical protein CBR_g39533 [Chara braunii]